MTTVQESATQPYSKQGTGPRAGFFRRFGAALLDAILIGIVNVILEVALKGIGYALAVLVAITYYTYLEGGASGQTIGKRALGIRVISLDSGGPIGYGRAFIRFIGRYVSAIVILIGYFWMLWDKESQCWHDKFAGDVVVPISAYPPPR